MENQYRFVEFEKYCKTCKHYKLKEKFDPCNECMDEGARLDSAIPVCYEEKEK